MEKITLSQIGLYNPRRQNSELTEKLFVIRHKQFEMLMEAIADEKENSIPQHHIIIAQRGMGKTTILHRIAIELHKKEYEKRFIPLSFPEEQYDVTSLGDFWLNCLDALADALEDKRYNGKYATEVEHIDSQIKELVLNKKSEETSAKAYHFLMEVCRRIKRRPVLLIDNIGLLFNRLNKKEQHVLRSLLSENGAPIVMGAGVIVLPSQVNKYSNTIIPITNYEAPFYDYFQIHHLKKLSFEEFRDLLINLATVTQTDVSIIDKETPRLKTLHQLTGGNPRTAVMLFKLIVKGFSKEINDDLEALLDEITPLYKARYEELSEQSQTIIVSIALNWEPISLKNLSQQSGYGNHQLSPQLIRLIEEGWIETTPAEKAKGNAYYISERFFNIWFLMRMSTRRHKQSVNLLTKFLESFYGNDLEGVANNHLCKDYQSENDFMQAIALRNSKRINKKLRNEIENKILSSCNSDVIENDYLRDEIDNIKDKKIQSLFEKGNTYYYKGNYDKAIEYYEKAIELKSDDEVYYNMGYVYCNKGNYDKAIECYEKAIELKPDKNEAYNNMGNAYYNKGNYDKAIECYEKAIELKPDKDKAYYNMGNAYYNKGNYDKAIECYEKAIELKPDDEAYYNMGNAYENKGDYDKAIECYEKAIELKPDKNEAYNNMGFAYENKGDYDKVIECYEKAIELKPDKNEAYNNMGNTYYYKGNYDKAIEYYEKAIELKPNLTTYNNLKFLYRNKLGEIPNLRKLFNAIKDILETDERFLQETLFELHNRNEGIAKEFLSKALQTIENELPKTTIEEWYYFAAICLQLNYGNWFLNILKEKGFDKILSPYFVAVQALEIEQKENKEKAEIYLKNRAIEISEPARMIIEKIRTNYLYF